MLRLLVLLLPVAAFPPAKPAAKPTLVGAIPLAADLGKSTKLTLRGQNLDGLTAVRVHDPKSSGKLAGKPKKSAPPNNTPVERVGDWEVEVEITLAAEVPGGWVAVSVAGPGGESNPVKVAVDDLPRVAEKEPNDGFEQVQMIAAPCAVAGTIKQPNDADVYMLTGKKGDVLRIEVQAARLGSPVDAVLSVADIRHRILGVCDDANGSADPILTVTLPADGDYLVMVTDANDQGGAMFAYRLLVRR